MDTNASKEYKSAVGDFAIVNLGENRAEEDKKFIAIVFDDENLIDIIPVEGERGVFTSKLTEKGRSVANNAMSQEAIKSGAKVINAKGCVDGEGDVARYSDDSVTVFDSEGVLVGHLSEEEEFMLENHLIVEIDNVTGRAIFPKKHGIHTEGLINIPSSYQSMYNQIKPALNYVKFLPFGSKVPVDVIIHTLDSIIKNGIIEFSDEPREPFFNWLKGSLS